MNVVKKPETIITLLNTAALLGASIYFYKKIQGLEEDLNKHSEHLTFTVKQTKELMPLKTQMNKVAAAIREINTNMNNGLSFHQKETEILREFVKFQNIQIGELYSLVQSLKPENSNLEIKNKDNPNLAALTYGQQGYRSLPQPGMYQPHVQPRVQEPRVQEPRAQDPRSLIDIGAPQPQPQPSPYAGYPHPQPQPQQPPMGYPQPPSGYSPQPNPSGYPHPPPHMYQPQQPPMGYQPGYPQQPYGYPPQQPYHNQDPNDSIEEDEDALIDRVRARRGAQNPTAGADTFFSL